MRCIICHNNPILNVNPKTQARKRLIIYNSFNGIIALRKHVNSNHPNIFKKIEKEINCLLRKDEKKFPKIDQMFFLIPCLGFFATKEPFKKDDV